jgi:hypothetical protein
MKKSCVQQITFLLRLHVLLKLHFCSNLHLIYLWNQPWEWIGTWFWLSKLFECFRKLQGGAEPDEREVSVRNNVLYQEEELTSQEMLRQVLKFASSYNYILFWIHRGPDKNWLQTSETGPVLEWFKTRWPILPFENWT